MTEWCRLEPADALRELKADAARGLSAEEAARRLTELGPNELTEHGTKSPWRILLEQVSSLMVVILVIAAVASAALGDYNDAVVIIAIVVINTLLGFRQEYRAEKTMAALRQLAMPTVRVRRDGGVLGVPARDLVPGDVVLLEAGNLVPADCRLLEAANLRIQEATLTGESEPVEKITGALGGTEIALCDRLNMVYSGTAVTYGRGEGLVVATGMETELGHIAGMIQGVVREATPLQKRLSQLGRGLAAAALALVALIFVLGLLRGRRAARHVPHRREHGCGRGARGAARGGDHRPVAGSAAHAQAPRSHPQAAGRGDAWIGHRDLFGQDRHAHPEPDDRGGAGRVREPGGSDRGVAARASDTSGGDGEPASMRPC